MRDVVIIGGGLGGLGAAYALQQRGVPYTLIDYRPRLGGSVGSHTVAGFTYDMARMYTFDRQDDPLYRQLGLTDALAVAREDDIGTWFTFWRGQQVLVDALTQPLTGKRLLRMAVTSVGMFDKAARAKGAPSFCVCLENGTVIDAAAIIVATPAVHAARMFRSLSQAAATVLEQHRYDSIARLNIGYRASDVRGKLPNTPPDEYPLTYIHTVWGGDARLPRVPEGCVLVQAGVRYDPAKGIAPDSNGDVVGEFAALFGLPETPLFEAVTTWDYDEPLMWLDDDFEARMARLRYALPAGVAVAGSDYLSPRWPRLSLAERVESGVKAAEHVLQA
jgi:protoporphyrinogen oxidase